MSIELERRVRQLETRLDELQRSVAAASPHVEEPPAAAVKPAAKPQRRTTARRNAR